MPWAGNIAKTMTSNGKQFTVTREMLTALAREQSVAWFCRRNLSAFFKICFCFVLLYNFVSGNIEILGKQNSLFPSGPYTKCLLLLCFCLVVGLTSLTRSFTRSNLLTSEVQIHMSILLVSLLLCFTQFHEKPLCNMLVQRPNVFTEHKTFF